MRRCFRGALRQSRWSPPRPVLRGPGRLRPRWPRRPAPRRRSHRHPDALALWSAPRQRMATVASAALGLFVQTSCKHPSETQRNRMGKQLLSSLKTHYLAPQATRRHAPWRVRAPSSPPFLFNYLQALISSGFRLVFARATVGATVLVATLLFGWA